jgi:hypothetical protein
MRRRYSPLVALVALLALVGLGGALFEESFVHTDDGCAVEVHCLGCRLAVGGAAVFAALPVVVPVARFVAFQPPATAPVVSVVAARLLRSRAPPLA